MVAKKVKNVPKRVENPINFSDPSQNIVVICDISPPRRWMMVTKNQPIKLPVTEAIKPSRQLSIKKSFTIKLSRAPRHFMVPISLYRSVTAINIALVIPTVQTTSAIIESQSWRFCAAITVDTEPVAGNNMPVRTATKKAMPRKMPDAVINERQNRIRMLSKLI